MESSFYVAGGGLAPTLRLPKNSSPRTVTSIGTRETMGRHPYLPEVKGMEYGCWGAATDRRKQGSVGRVALKRVRSPARAHKAPR